MNNVMRVIWWNGMYPRYVFKKIDFLERGIYNQTKGTLREEAVKEVRY